MLHRMMAVYPCMPRGDILNKLLLVLLVFVMPLASFLVESLFRKGEKLNRYAKWFIFWAIGMRCSLFGLVQIISPGSGIDHGCMNATSFVCLRELGLALLIFGLSAIASLFLEKQRLFLSGGAFFLGIGALFEAYIAFFTKQPFAQSLFKLGIDIYTMTVLLVYLGILAARKIDMIRREQSLL